MTTRRSSPSLPAIGTAAASSGGPCSQTPLDLRSGHNRFGPPAEVLRAADEALRSTRPDILAEWAREAISERFGVAKDRAVLGHGGSGLIWDAARALVEPGCRWLSVEPTVSVFAAAARAAGAKLTQWRAVERSGYRVELDQVAELATLVQPKVVSLSAPGDPTGACVSWAKLCSLAEAFPDTTVLVDQSWLSLSADHADLELIPPSNVICIRSLSVELALTGLRAGYLLCSADVAARIERARPRLAVSAPAAAAIGASLHARDHLAHCRSELQADAAGLRRVLDALDLTHTPSVTPLSLVRIDRAGQVADELVERHGIDVYDATAVGLPDHVRISAPAPDALGRLRAALEEVIERRRLVRGREAIR